MISIENKKRIAALIMAGVMLLTGAAGALTSENAYIAAAKTVTSVAKTDAADSTKTNTPGYQSQGNPPNGTVPGAPPNGGGNTAASTVKGTAAFTLDGSMAAKSNSTLKAVKANQSAVKVSNKGIFSLSKVTLNKASGNTSSEDNSNFYGLNAALLAEGGSSITIKDSTVTSSASGANAVFSTGTGSKITLNNVNIKTTKDSSRGIDATMKGTIIANNVNISTAGIHSASIATDRGEGTIKVTGGSMSTSGQDSPGIYSTGDISVTGAKLTATGSEAAVIEGKNSITLSNTELTGYKKNGVMMYQSFSGDAAVGTSKYTMVGGKLTSDTGAIFYITNTNAEISLKDAQIKGKSGILIKAGADRWGTTGSNGGNLKFAADNETISGSVVCDKISTVSISLKNGTILTADINKDNTAKLLKVSIDKLSKWNVSGTSYVSSLLDEDTSFSNIKDNGNTIYYDVSNSDNSYLEGKTYTLTDGGKLTPVTK